MKKRPHVSVNMAMSLDGRISTRKHERITLGSRHDRRLMDVLRAESDAVIVGAGTLRHDGFPILVRSDDVRSRRVAKGRPPHPVNVIMSRSLVLPTNRPFFQRTDTERLVYTTQLASATRVRRLQRLAEVVMLRRKTLSPTVVLADLYDRGARKVLLEGGGEIHYAFLADGAVDDIYIAPYNNIEAGFSRKPFRP